MDVRDGMQGAKSRLVASQQSPTTHRFFTLSELMETTSKARIDFVASIVALAGIKTKSKPPARTKKS
ncbi:MAG: hypothetical protein Q7T46_07870 [Polaromonas sp.]|nr:hypothetical protein [Polaromonas sp.]